MSSSYGTTAVSYVRTVLIDGKQYIPILGGSDLPLLLEEEYFRSIMPDRDVDRGVLRIFGGTCIFCFGFLLR